MFFSAVGKVFERFWLAALAAAGVACVGLYVRHGSVSLSEACAIAGVSVLAMLVLGLPLEYRRRTR